MRNILSLVFAGMIGGLLTLGGFYMITNPTTQTVPQVKQVNTHIPINRPAYSASIDFTNAASKTMPTVVHMYFQSKKNWSR